MPGISKTALNLFSVNDSCTDRKDVDLAPANAGLSGYWEIQVDPPELYWSNEMRQIYGLSRDIDISLDTAISACHPDDQNKARDHFSRAIDNGENFQIDLRVPDLNGKVRHIRSTGFARKSPDGHATHVSGFCQDISAEIETRETLVRSEAIFASFVEQSPSAILIKAPDGRYQMANSKWHEWFNPDNLAIEGMTVADFVKSDMADLISHQDLQVADKKDDVESRHILPISNGQNLNILTQKFPILDDSKNVIGIGSINTDISELTKAEAIQDRLFEALDAISDGYVFYDSERRFLHCNRRYREFYQRIDDVLVPGNSLDSITRTSAERIRNAIGIEDIDAWVEQRLTEFEDGAEGQTRTLLDGRILLCSDSRSADGGYVGTRTDITDLKRAEAVLQESEQRFQMLFDTAVVSIWDEDFSFVIAELELLRANGVVDIDQYLRGNLEEAFRLAGLVKINAVNDATLPLYGVASKSEFIDRLNEIMNEETIFVFIGVLNAIWHKEEEYKTEATHLTFDGREITIAMSFPIPETPSEWQHVPVCIFDITDQKKAEDDLREYQITLALKVEERTRDLRASEEKLRDLIDGSLQGIVVQTGLKIMFVNDTLAEMFGYTHDELMNIGNIQDLCAPGEVERLDRYQRLRRDGGEVPDYYEFEGQKKDGSRVWVLNRVRKVNWDGQNSVQSTIVDITERKEAEEALAKSERMYRSILETSPIGMGITNARTGAAKFVNDAHLKLMGINREAFLKTRGGDFWYDIKDRYEFVKMYAETGRAEGIIRQKRVDGTPFWAVQRWEQSPLDKGDVLFWTYDISELKNTRDEMEKARDEATRASKAKSDFLSSMSHELRTPLNAILGFGQLLQTSPDDPLSSDHQDSADRIMTGGLHLLNLVNDVLDLAKIESGAMTVAITDFSPLEVLENCLHFIASSARDRNITVTSDVSETAQSLIRADSVRLKQVFLNLLSNAVKYNREGGTVTVTCEQTDAAMLRFSISDTGEGISANDQLQLFQPFNRLAAEHSEIEGTGIGLTITRELLGLMGGEVGMRSTVGEGSTFWFDIPLEV
ncbi:MAG: PAS domain S-box protein [Alphaproteobacteria bacterium]|nr:PAS domain S-box protein [Alphaproteobacteria bacterium]